MAKKESAQAKVAKPKKERFAAIKQMRQLYAMTKEVDPQLTLWMVLATVLTLAVVIGITALLSPWWWMGIIFGIPLAGMAAMLVLGRRAERAMYTRMEGQPGASSAALRMIRTGWTVEEEPVAIDPRTKDMVFRAVGKPGVVLVGEGNPARASKLVDTEAKRLNKLLPGVPVHTFVVGDGVGETPLPKLPKQVRRLKGTLTRDELAQVIKRLRSLGSIRQQIPRGVDPNRARIDRKAMRGR